MLPSTTLSPTPKTARPADHAAKRADIEGLRGIAVLLVVLYHAGIPFVPGGYIGVDVFFVLSGYLITGLLIDEFEKTGRLDLLGFYARRARRLLPASCVMLLVVALVGTLVLSPLEMKPLAGTTLWTAVYSSNLWFLRFASSYFDPAADTNPLLHTWSLAVEEQFYMLWPVLILAVLRYGRGRRKLAWAMLALAALSLGGAIYFTRTNQPWAFFFSPLRAWEFAVGGLAVMVPLEWLRRRQGDFLVWLGAVGLRQ
jgi:peptidoglycan/LPS O-acetylase OafA/YrhL